MSRNKYKTIGLGLSVILNMLLIGIFIGQRLHTPPFGGHPHHKEFGPKFFFKHEDFKQNEKGIRASEKKLEETMLKEPYNEKDVLEALESFDNNMKKLRQSIHKKIAEEAGKLEPEERLRLIPGRRFRH